VQNAIKNEKMVDSIAKQEKPAAVNSLSPSKENRGEEKL
jgi:hypothetical protein